MPYKRSQIVHVLESLIEREDIHDVNPTTKRLVQRCLAGDWCVQFRKTKSKHTSSVSDTQSISSTESLRSPALESVSSAGSGFAVHASGSNALLAVSGAVGRKSSLKASRSFENMQSALPASIKEKERHAIRLGSNDSSTSLPRVAAAAAVEPSLSRRRDRAGSMDTEVPSSAARRATILDDVQLTAEPVSAPEIHVVSSPFSPTEMSPLERFDSPTPLAASSLPASPVPKPRKTAPAPPPRRRKPPAIPAKAGAGVTITTIASSASTPASPRLHSALRNGAISR